MFRRLLVATVGAMLLSQAVPTGAGAAFDPCNDPGRTVIDVGGRAYVDIRYVGQPYAEMVWTYLESNGIDDLQRGGVGMIGGMADQCHDANLPDTLVF